MAIFRKVALERLSNPEQLDQLMQVTSPRGWLALWAMVAVAAGALAWGVFGAIPTEALGEGILIRRGGVSDLVATGSGQVEQLLVNVGDEVAKGQVVARVRQEGITRQIAETKARIAALDTEYQDLLQYAAEQQRLSSRNRAQEKANLERTVGTLERELALLEERLANEKSLLADGLVTKQTVLTTEQQLNASRDRLAQTRLDLSGLDLKQLESGQQLDQQIQARRAEKRDLDLKLAELEASLEESVAVVSPYDGRVLELMADRGDVVSPGTAILSMEVVSEELMAVLYVPASAGKQVRPGLVARISPSNVKREEYGFIVGKVVWAAEFPSTSRGMLRLLANQELVTKLMLEGPPIQVDVALEKDPNTPTGFKWSSSRGPELDISSGTLASGSVIVREERPINLVIPKLRKSLGIE
jgi:HlyD family secretion protein